MFKHILIPTDGSELSAKAIRAGVDLAKAIGARVTGFCAMRDPFRVYGGWVPFNAYSARQMEWDDETWAREKLAAIEQYATSAGVTYEGVHRTFHHAYRGIIEVARERNCDLIFMASHGRRGPEALLLGSETTKVLTHCKLPVLVYR
jgi:nucleotide-binding universal stress UspA family protein